MRFCVVTNVLNTWTWRESLAMYPRTTLLSVQNHSTALLVSSSSRSVVLTFTETRVAVSLNEVYLHWSYSGIGHNERTVHMPFNIWALTKPNIICIREMVQLGYDNVLEVLWFQTSFDLQWIKMLKIIPPTSPSRSRILWKRAILICLVSAHFLQNLLANYNGRCYESKWVVYRAQCWENTYSSKGAVI